MMQDAINEHMCLNQLAPKEVDNAKGSQSRNLIALIPAEGRVNALIFDLRDLQFHEFRDSSDAPSPPTSADAGSWDLVTIGL